MTLFTCLWISAGSLTHSQWVVRGHTIAAGSQEALAGVHVFLEEELVAVSAADGSYRVNAAQGYVTLRFKHLGFEDVVREIHVQSDTLLPPVPMVPAIIHGKDVVVSGDRPTARAAGSSVTLDAGTLQRTRGATLGESLAQVSGVHLLRTGQSVAKPVIRGLHSNRIVTMQAGIAQEGQQWGGEHAPEIDPFSAGSIEILKGTAGVEYGPGAIGGVIRVNPRHIDPANTWKGSLDFQGFSNSRQGATSVNVEGNPVPYGKWGWRIQGSLRRAGDAQTPDYIINNSGFAERSVNSTIQFRHRSFSARAYGSYYATTLGIYAGAHIGSPNDFQRAIDRGRPLVEEPFSHKIANPKQEIRHALLALEGAWLQGKSGVIEFRYGTQQNHRQEYDAHGRFGRELTAPAFDLQLTTHQADLGYLYAAKSGFSGKAGINLKRQGNVRRSVGYLIPNFRSYDSGLFVLGKKERGTVLFEGGARVDYHWIRVYAARSAGVTRNTRYWVRPAFTAGASWNISEKWQVSVSSGTGWRPPGVHERFSRGVHHGTAQYELGDADLQPEFATRTELSVHKSGTSISGSVALYSTFFRNYIQLRPDGEIIATIRGAFPRYNYHQTRARMDGFEATVSVTPASFFESHFTVSSVLGTNLTHNEPLYMIPPTQFSWKSVFRVGSRGAVKNISISGGMGVHLKQQRYPVLVVTDVYREPPPPPGYILTDMGLAADLFFSAKRAPAKIQVDVANLFNTNYRDYLSRFRFFIDEPGRDVILKLHIPLGNVRS